jgi:hypothetical protein
MAILGLVFAFVFSPLGIVFSAIGLGQTKKRGEGGRGLAIAGLILSILFTLIGLLLFFFVFAAVSEAVQTGAIEEAPAAASPAEDSSADAQGVREACEVIVPAILTFESDMATVTTPEEYVTVIGDVRTTIEGAAATSSDAVFVQDVQLLSDDLQLTADTVSSGEDPTYLEAALTEDGTRVDEHCMAAGYTP